MTPFWGFFGNTVTGHCQQVVIPISDICVPVIQCTFEGISRDWHLCGPLCLFADFMHCSFIFGKCAVFIYKTQHLFFGKHLVVGFMLLFRWNFSKGQLKVHTEYVKILCVLSYSNATGITNSCKISFKCSLLTIGWTYFIE